MIDDPPRDQVFFTITKLMNSFHKSFTQFYGKVKKPLSWGVTMPTIFFDHHLCVVFLCQVINKYKYFFLIRKRYVIPREADAADATTLTRTCSAVKLLLTKSYSRRFRTNWYKKDPPSLCQKLAGRVIMLVF